MFDLSWGEVLMIGAVALIVIGPKDLPGALRTLGRILGKARRMAGEFQSQFNEALREADLDQVRRDVEGLNKAASNVTNPARMIRDEMKGAIEGTGSKPSPAKPAADKLSPDKPSVDKPAAADPAQPQTLAAPTPSVETAPPVAAPTTVAAQPAPAAPPPQPAPVRTEEKNT